MDRDNPADEFCRVGFYLMNRAGVHHDHITGRKRIGLPFDFDDHPALHDRIELRPYFVMMQVLSGMLREDRYLNVRR